jgi:hypothetical protein
MSKKKFRDAAYFRRRLERDFPAIYADLLAKRYSSVRQAAAAAGLIHLPTRIDALKREWRMAKGPEQTEFLKWLEAEYGLIVSARAPTIPTTVPAKLVGSDGLLLPEVVHMVEATREMLGMSSAQASRL